MNQSLRTNIPSRVLGATALAAALALAPVQSTLAVTCPDFNIPASASSATANICGVVFNASLSSAGTFTAAGASTSAEGTINGVPVRISAGSIALNDVTRTTPVQLFVNGNLEFSGTLSDLSSAEAQRLLALLRGLEGNAVQSDTSRIGSSRSTAIVAGRIGNLLRPGGRGGSTDGATSSLDTGGNDLRIRGLSVRDGADPMRRDWSTGTVGLSAGENGGNSSAWGSISHTWLGDDATLTRFDGRLALFTVGYDRVLPGGWVVGVAGVVESSDVDTTFNDGDTDTIGASIVPYIGKSLFDGNASFDMQVGYGRLNTDTARNRTTGIATGDFDSYRLFGAANLASYHSTGNWLMTGRVGVLATHEGSDEYVESNGNRVSDQNITLVQVSVGGEARYDMGHWSPYVGATYVNDVRRTGITALAASRDDDEVQVEAGASFAAGTNLSADLSVTHSLGRSDMDETTLLGSLRYNF